MWAWMRSLSVVRCSCVHRRIAEVAALVVDSCSGICCAGFAGCSSRCVPCGRFQARDALHHGRYGPEGQLCSGMCKARFAGLLHLAMCSSYGSGPDALHRGRYGPEGQLRCEMVVVILSLRRGSSLCFTEEIPQVQFLTEVIDVPGMQVVQVLCRLPVVCNDRCPPQQFINKVVYTPVVAQSLIPDHRDSPVAVLKLVDVPVVLVVRVPQLPFVRRQSCSHSCSSWRKSSRLDVVVFPVVSQRPDSHCPACLADHRGTPVALRQG